jgi:hypothetical protein
MRCPFYGKHAVPWLPLIDSGGNQCALILDSFSPCFMEVTMQAPPEADECILLTGLEKLHQIGLREAARWRSERAAFIDKGPRA